MLDLTGQLKASLENYFSQVEDYRGGLFVLGCSTSEILGHWMGSDSDQEIGEIVVAALLSVLNEHNINLAVQGCQHINRALLVERNVAKKIIMKSFQLSHHFMQGELRKLLHINYSKILWKWNI